MVEGTVKSWEGNPDDRDYGGISGRDGMGQEEQGQFVEAMGLKMVRNRGEGLLVGREGKVGKTWMAK